MKKAVIFLVCLLFFGCSSSVLRSWSHWQSDSLFYSDYEIRITSLPTGATIEWDGRQIGKTPLAWKLNGYLYAEEKIIVSAIPGGPNQYPQIKEISMDAPSSIHFDMTLKPAETKTGDTFEFE